MTPITTFPREIGISDANGAIIDIAEALGAVSYAVHTHQGSAGFSIMLTFCHAAGVFQVRDALRGRLQ